MKKHRSRERALGRSDIVQPDGLRTRPHEQLLMDVAAEEARGNVLCNTAGRGQFARLAATLPAVTKATCCVWDCYQQLRTREHLIDEEVGPVPPAERMDVVCQADVPAGEFETVALALGRRGESEFTRELLQSAHQQLVLGGRFLAATDHTDDQWLHAELRKLFRKVTRRPSAEGTLYLATKTEPLRRLRSFEKELRFRDGERTVYVKTRPGVFSHREIDGGARALLQLAQVRDGWQVLDLGCGSGAVALAMAQRAKNVRVLAVDSSPRALDCVEWGITKNGLPQVETILDADGCNVPAGQCELVLANPPYFSQYKIAELFVHTAYKALHTRGCAMFVTKTPDWFIEQMSTKFRNVSSQPMRDYVVVTGYRGLE